MVKFFKKKEITRTANPDSLYPDLYDNGKQNMDLQVGSVNDLRRNQFMLLDGDLPESPEFGDTSLVGAKLALFVNSIDVGDNASTPALKAWKNNSILGDNEGGASNSTMVADANVAAFSFYLNDISTIEENFDSFDPDTEQPLDIRKIAKSTVIQSKPYLTKEDGYHYGTKYANGYYENKYYGVSEDSHFDRYGTDDPNLGEVYFIEKRGTNAYKTTKTKKLWHGPNTEVYNKERVQKKIQYATTVPLQPDNFDSAQDAIGQRVTESNSIFTYVGREQPFLDLNKNGEVKQVAWADITFSTDNVLSEGSAAKMHCYYPSMDKQRTNIVYDKKGGLAYTENRQCTFMTTPIPTPTTLAKMWQGTDVNATPTIEIDFNIEKLAPVLQRRLYDTADSTDLHYHEVASAKQTRLNRCFAITCSEEKPLATDDLFSFVKRHQGGTGTGVGSAKDFFGITYYNHEGTTMYGTLNKNASSAATHNTELDGTLNEIILKGVNTNNGVDYDTDADWSLDGWVKCIITLEEGKTAAQIGHFSPDGTQSKGPIVETVTNFSGDDFDHIDSPKWLTTWLVNFPSLHHHMDSTTDASEKQLSGLELDGDMGDGTATKMPVKSNNKVLYKSDAIDLDVNKAIDIKSREFLNLVPGNKVLLGSEVVLITDRSTTQGDPSYTIVRGTDDVSPAGTAAANHGANVQIHITDGNSAGTRSGSGGLEKQIKEPQDTESIVYIDSIKFKNFNGQIENATVCSSNINKGQIKIPSPKSIYTNHNNFGFGQSTLGRQTGSYPDLSFAKQLMPSYLAFGFNDAADVEGGTTRYMLLNGFSSGNLSTDAAIFRPTASATLDTETTNIRAGYSTVTEALGKQNQTAFFDTDSGVPSDTSRGLEVGDVGGTGATALEIGLGSTDASAVENFTQKGLVLFNFDGQGGPTGNSSHDRNRVMTKRECIYASARVVSVVDQYTIRVDNPDVFRMPKDETYVVYQYGASAADANRVTSLTVVDYNGKNITFQKPHGVDISNIQTFMVSPERFWVVFEIYNIGTSIYGGRGANTTHVPLPDKSYESAIMVTGAQTAGATYNETLFNDGKDINRRQLEFFEKSDGNSIVFADYGFGDIDNETGKGGHIGYKGINRTTDDDSYVEIDISGAIQDLEFGDTIPIALGPDTPSENFKINVDSEAGTNKPYILAIIEDEKPEITNFQIKPNDIDAYNIDLTWSCESEDAWYGFILIDDEKGIPNQYKGAIMHIPMNDEGVDGADAGTIANKVGNISTSAGGGTDVRKPHYNIEGLAGYTLQFDGSNDNVTLGATNGNDDPFTAADNGIGDVTDEFSVVAHIVHDGTDVDANGDYIIKKNSFELFVDQNEQIVARFYSDANSALQLISTSKVQAGIPMNIIATFDSLLTEGNCKLFINGKLEDVSGVVVSSHGDTTDNTIKGWILGTDLHTADGVMFIGNETAAGTTKAFDGKIEEVVFYNEVLYPVNPKVGKFTLTKPLSELNASTNASSKSYSARLFVKDYHNIRGTTSEEVAASPVINFRKAAFDIDAS